MIYFRGSMRDIDLSKGSVVLNLTPLPWGMSAAYQAIAVEGPHKLEAYKKAMLISHGEGTTLVSKLDMRAFGEP